MKRRNNRNSIGSILTGLTLIALFAGLPCALSAAPALRITQAAPFLSFGSVQGTASGVVPADYIVALVIYVPGSGWWSKPTCDSRYVNINADGTWSGTAFSAGLDHVAAMVEAYLIPRSSYPACYASCISGAVNVPAALVSASVASDRLLRQGQRTIRWSGYDWLVKNSDWGAVGPGGNYFSDSSANVWVDADGKLHMKITNAGGHWRSAEISSTIRMGYGAYRYHLDSRLDNLDQNAVLGLYTWSDFTSPNNGNREIDFEFSKWSGTILPNNAQFVVQPSGTPGNLLRYQMTSAPTSTTILTWHPDQISFFCVEGHVSDPSQGHIVSSWQYSSAGAIPPSADERVHINLWLNQGSAPSNGQPVEVVISSLEFVPYRPRPVYGISSRMAAHPLTAAVSNKTSFKVWGKVTARDCGGITLDDGALRPIRVLEPGQMFRLGDYLSAEGIFISNSPKILDSSSGRVSFR